MDYLCQFECYKIWHDFWTTIFLKFKVYIKIIYYFFSERYIISNNYFMLSIIILQFIYADERHLFQTEIVHHTAAWLWRQIHVEWRHRSKWSCKSRLTSWGNWNAARSEVIDILPCMFGFVDSFRSSSVKMFYFCNNSVYRPSIYDNVMVSL